MWNYLPAIRFLSVATKCKSSTKTSCIKRRCWLLTERPKTADNGFKSCWQRTKKTGERSAGGRPKSKSQQKKWATRGWACWLKLHYMLPHCPSGNREIVEDRYTWISNQNMLKIVGLCVLYQGPHITCINHTHQSWIVWNCVVEVLHQAGVKTCMSHTESPVKGWISHGTPLLSETGQFTRFSTTCWISHIFAILPLFYPRRPWHFLACRFHTTCDKSFSDFTQILFRSIFQLCNNRLPTKVWLVLSWPTSTYSQHTMQIDFSTFKHFKMPKNYLIRVSSKQMRVSSKAIFHHFHIACSFRFFSIRTIEWWTVFRGQTHYSPLQQFWRNRPKVNWQQLSNCFLGREKGLKRLFSTIIYGSALALWSGHHQKITI